MTQYLIIYDDNKKYKDYKAFIQMLGYEWTFHFASFQNLQQLEKFLNIFKVTLTLENNHFEGLTQFKISKIFKDDGYFWNLEELPKGCKKIKALSNGSIVDCYYKTTKKEIIFYRPNPNAKNVYKPLSTEEHIKFQKENGIY